MRCQTASQLCQLIHSFPSRPLNFENFTDSIQKHSLSEINENNFCFASGIFDVALIKICSENETHTHTHAHIHKCLAAIFSVLDGVEPEKRQSESNGYTVVGWFERCWSSANWFYLFLFFLWVSILAARVRVCCVWCVCVSMPICYHETKGIFRGENVVRKSFVFTVAIYVHVDWNVEENSNSAMKRAKRSGTGGEIE